MNFDEYWAIGIQANPLLGSSDVLRAIAEAAWNAGAREEREACALAFDRYRDAPNPYLSAGNAEFVQAVIRMRSNLK